MVSPIEHPPTTESITVEFMLAGIRSKSIDLDPEHQRGLVHSRKWQEGIIGSIFVIKMIPPVYFHTVFDGERYVDESVDGKQRLTAILHYCNNEFKYTLDDVPELKNKIFYELTPKLQHTILSFKLSVVKYNGQLDNSQIEYLFGRFNNTKTTRIGEKLNACVDSNAYTHIKQLAHEGVMGAIQPTNNRNQHMDSISRMAYMVYENTLTGITNDSLYRWFHITPYTKEDAKKLSCLIREVAGLMTELDLKNKNAKGRYLAVLWFLMKHDENDVHVLRTKGAHGRFDFTSSGNGSDHDRVKKKYKALCDFVRENKEPNP